MDRPLKLNAAKSAFVLQYLAVVLILTHRCEGQSQLAGPTQPVVATLGDDITLQCRLEPAVDASDLTVEWTRPDLNPRFVHVLRDGVELKAKKHQAFVDRTSLSNNNLKRGDVSLKIYKVKLCDEGKYRCFIPTLNTQSSVQLVVGAVSSVTIRLTRTETDKDTHRMVLQCRSGGWYPEPEVSWLDSEGHVLSAGPPETLRGPDGLYTISSRVTVDKRHGNNFTCRVQQKDINQTRETQIHVPDDFYSDSCSCAAHIAISLSVVFMGVLAAVFVVWKERQKQNRHNSAEKIKTLDSTEVQLLNSETVKDLDDRRAALGALLNEVSEQCQDVEGALHFLMGHKSNVDTQLLHIILKLHGQKVPGEENHVKDSKDTTNGDGSQDTETNPDKEDLEKRRHEIDTYLKHVFCGICIVKEKKKMLDDEKEQIKKELEEIEKQRNTIQKMSQ